MESFPTPSRDAIFAELPRLRRYAYCLYGSRALGDARIENCLRQLMDRPQGLDGAQPAASLFRFFHSCEAAFVSTPGLARAGTDHLVPVHMAMMRLTPAERRVLGLVVVSGFSQQEAADILDIAVHTLSARLAAAKQHLRDLMPRAIIIEDEYLLAAHLMTLARDMGVVVCGTAANGRNANALAREYRPDLVLADVWLGADESGTDIAEDIRERYDSAVVYVTAYPDRVLARRPHSPFIVEKPVLSADLAEMIAHACDARFEAGTVH